MGDVKSKNQLVLIYAVFPKKFKIKKLAQDLIEKKLVVCANVIDKVQSIYQWQGKIESAEEQIVIFKTHKKLKTQAMKFILQKHPYDVPVVLEIKVDDLNTSYNDFLIKELTT
jgi:periplasmic divalent cation tolerance protein